MRVRRCKAEARGCCVMEGLELRRLLSGGPFDPQTWQFNEDATLAAVGEKVVLRLTSTPYWVGSAFNTTPVRVDRFDDVGFDFMIDGDYGADGFTFCLQARDPTAFGTGNHSLGYSNIGNSMAIKFDLWDPVRGSIVETGLYFNGERPKNSRFGGDIDLSEALGTLQGTLWRVGLSYDGSDLTLRIADPADPQRQFAHTWSVDLPSLIGSETAYAGFTGSTGDTPLQQDFHSFHWVREASDPQWIVDATGSDDERIVRRSGDSVRVENRNGDLIDSRLFDLAGSPSFNMLEGDDALTLDVSGGDLAPAGGSIRVNGGAGLDAVKIAGAGGRAVQVGESLLKIGSLTVQLDSVETVAFLDGGEALTLEIAGRTVSMADDGALLKVGGLTLAGGGALDLGSGRMIVAGGDPAAIGALIRGGQLRAKGAAYAALAAVLNRRPDGSAIHSSFGGQAVGTGDVLVKCAWQGDANLDGVVNADDYFQIDSGFISQQKGWYHGDFNYDQVVNADDYFLIDSAYIGQSGPLAADAVESAAGVTALAPAQPKKDAAPTVLAELFSAKAVL